MEGPRGCQVMTDCLPPSQGAAAHPDSEEQQQRLREAAVGLRMATNVAAQNAIKKKLVQRLEVRLGDKPGARERGCSGGTKTRRDVWREGHLLFPWRMAWAGSARDSVGECPGLVLTTLSSQHAAKQAAASATQTIAAAQHAASTPKVSAGPQPLLVQSCKVRLQEVCGRRGTFPRPVGGVILMTFSSAGCGRADSTAGAGRPREPSSAGQSQCPASPYCCQPELPSGKTPLPTSQTRLFPPSQVP